MIDSHVHIASHDVERYPLQPLGGGGTKWWQNPVSAEDLLAEMDRTDVDRAVIVHAFGAYSFDCRYTVDGAKVDPRRLSAVVAVDASAPDGAGAVAALAADPIVTGVRLFAARPEDADWLGDSSSFAVWDACAAAGVNVVLVALSGQLGKVEPALRAKPDVVTVIDHCGMPDLVDGLIPEDNAVFRFVDLPNVHMKVSTPLLAAGGRTLMEQVVAVFGAERVVWGSDYPQTREPDYPGMVALARDATAGLSSSDREAVLEATAARLWFPARA